eukprot:CAMPEP_0172079520 /NCGR_PEP_ID=MMETSP1043-20130122/18218_1 /TAXON_ID=464988 /ORGANISM="Hemiselmis andersenii, Strain CCMP441" /LENGTH=40 /DNA_ID= /DNA_START= /DNA_END= /DNA_ORIENTATION=
MTKHAATPAMRPAPLPRGLELPGWGDPGEVMAANCAPVPE